VYVGFLLLLLLLLLLFFIIREGNIEYILKREKGRRKGKKERKKGTTKTTNLAPNMIKCLHEEVYRGLCQIRGKICSFCSCSWLVAQIFIVRIIALHFKPMYPLTIYNFHTNPYFVVAEMSLQDDMMTNQFAERFLVEVSLL